MHFQELTVGLHICVTVELQEVAYRTSATDLILKIVPQLVDVIEELEEIKRLARLSNQLVVDVRLHDVSHQRILSFFEHAAQG